MREEAELQEACERWKTLALVEGEAIRSRDWPRLAACHQALEALQPLVTRVLQAARLEWSRTGAEAAAVEQRLRDYGRELVEINRQNSSLLAEARRGVLAQLTQYQQTASRLRHLRASYLPARPAGWTSFS